MNNHALTYSHYGPPLECLTMKASSLAVRPSTHFRVVMTHAPINPSDLIPITGAYAHRTALPCVAGYEGVGHIISSRGLPPVREYAFNNWRNAIKESYFSGEEKCLMRME